MTIQTATAEGSASPLIPTASRLSLSAQVIAATAGESRVREILDLAARQRQAADNELFAARLVVENAVIPGTDHVRRFADAAGRAAQTQLAIAVEEAPVEVAPEDEPNQPEDEPPSQSRGKRK